MVVSEVRVTRVDRHAVLLRVLGRIEPASVNDLRSAMALEGCRCSRATVDHDLVLLRGQRRVMATRAEFGTGYLWSTGG